MKGRWSASGEGVACEHFLVAWFRSKAAGILCLRGPASACALHCISQTCILLLFRICLLVSGPVASWHRARLTLYPVTYQ